jgi:hypothetical protein
MITLNNRIMEHKIINTRNYLLIVDESEIKEGDWYIDLNLKQIFSKSNPQISKIDWQKKIIGHLPLNNSPILEGVPLLPPLEDEVEKLADEHISQFQVFTSEYHNKNDFIAGYNKAKEKYKYTEEDIKKAFRAGFIQRNEAKTNSCDNLIQSLQQPKMPIGFKCEMEEYSRPMPNIHSKYYLPKTTTNSQSLTQWVGEYIYE